MAGVQLYFVPTFLYSIDFLGELNGWREVVVCTSALELSCFPEQHDGWFAGGLSWFACKQMVQQDWHQA